MLAPPCQPSKYFCHEFLSSGTANKEAVNSQMPSPTAEGIVKSQSADSFLCALPWWLHLCGANVCCFWIFISVLILKMEHQQVLIESAQAGLSHPFLSHFPASESNLCPLPFQPVCFPGQAMLISSPHIPVPGCLFLISPRNLSLSEAQTWAFLS